MWSLTTVYLDYAICKKKDQAMIRYDYSHDFQVGKCMSSLVLYVLHHTATYRTDLVLRWLMPKTKKLLVGRMLSVKGERSFAEMVSLLCLSSELSDKLTMRSVRRAN